MLIGYTKGEMGRRCAERAFAKPSLRNVSAEPRVRYVIDVLYSPPDRARLSARRHITESGAWFA